MALPAQIARLIETFEQNREDYLHGRYSETQLRREYLDPFFKALGWDVDNTQGYAEAYKDVIHEDAIRIGSATKAPDYCFRIGGTRKFFVEAKAPTVNLKDNPEPAYQVRRYAWSAKLPLSILTDFEEFAVYDCRIRPAPSDKASKGRVKYYRYTDYAEHWDEIASIFSRDAVLKGSFDKYAASEKRKQGTAEVDAAFLAEIEDWRDKLARNIALRNPGLNNRQLNYAVQITIDRVIFLRICEDRGIERYGELMALVNGADVYQRLMGLFRKADDRYNSGLFHFQREKDRHEGPDELTPELAIDDKPLKEIIRSQYYPDSPYEFSVLPAEILGQVYEQFLGKVIVLTPGHHAKVEDKPEVKKAGGVFYTPSYIVDYIVKQTVGKLLEGASVTLYKTKPPKLDRPLRVLDPACGSGSFLLGAYQLLLDWHLDYYQNHDPKSWAAIKEAPICSAAGNGWKLTTRERKRILLDHIYGVDIDTQAVEVTKLSLLLKVLEGEKNLVLFHNERALPDLSDNIKCGNSLIGSDFYRNQQSAMFDAEDQLRLNAFDWHDAFSEFFTNGGFDAIIGNPPWGSLITPSEKAYLHARYVSKQGEAESHLYFIEQAISLLKPDGTLGFITPNTWLMVKTGQAIRSFLLEQTHVQEIMQLSKYIFADAPDVVPILVFLSKTRDATIPAKVRTSTLLRIDAANFVDAFSTQEIAQDVWLKSKDTAINIYSTATTLRIVDRCNKKAVPLSAVSSVLYGIKTGNNKRYLSRTQTPTHTKKALKSGELARYRLKWKGLYLWWCPDLAGYRMSCVEVPKIVVQYIRKLSLPRRIVATLDRTGEHFPLNNYSYIVQTDPDYSLDYILGLLNSRLLNFYFANTFIDYNIKPTYLKQLPICSITFSDPAQVNDYGRIASLVQTMMLLNTELARARTPNDKEIVERQIAITDREIDRLVYELYGLTEEEIRIVEGATQV